MGDVPEKDTTFEVVAACGRFRSAACGPVLGVICRSATVVNLVSIRLGGGGGGWRRSRCAIRSSMRCSSTVGGVGERTSNEESVLLWRERIVDIEL